MISSIVFDLGGVLFTNGTKVFAQHLADTYNSNPSTMYGFLSEGPLGTAYREGDISREQFWDAIRAELHLTESIEELEAIWIRGYHLIEGTKKILDELRENYSLYYLSDNVRERVEKIHAHYGFLDWFDGGIFSHEVGVRKPDPRVYEYLFTSLGIVPNESIFVDDKETNVVPAQKLGMHGIVFTSPEQLRKDLIAHSIRLA